MKVGKIVPPEQLRQMAVGSAAKSKNVEQKRVQVQATKNGPSVEVKVGSGLEKTAMANAIYKG